ncbi:WcaG Nucleoside-diphosphate-sugar epimerases [Candidatus Nanopelagicaceae bacterium]
MTKKVVLFGASGFIGRAILSKLKSELFDVTPIRSKASHPQVKAEIASISIDFHNSQECRKILEEIRPDVIVSAAWYTALPDYRQSELNVKFMESTINLARIAHNLGTSHLIILGSSAEYGHSNLECNSTSSIPNPADLYSKCKFETYKEISWLLSGSATKLSWLRIFQPFGKYQDSSRLIPYLISECKAGRSPKLLDPDRISDWISIEDIASALVFAMRNSLPEVIDVGSGIGTTNRELANWIIEMSGAQISDSGTSKTCLEAKGLVVSKESPVFQAGWHPRVNLRTYLAQTY